MSVLPVDRVIPELLNALADSTGVVLQAPPGSGKTSRVPLALLNCPAMGNGRIVMLEPRRLAAVNAASWLAGSLGEEVGRRVGYSIRFDRKVSRETAIEVVTEGLLTRRIQADPTLADISAVIFDEFHERSLNADTSLAFCLDIQRTIRPDLKIVVMSATIDTAAIAAMLGGVPVISCDGKVHPVDIRYLGEPGEQLARTVCQGVARALRETSGDILVFLPGAGEIRQCHELLDGMAEGDLLITDLYGDLPFDAQERAIMPARKRKVVLATNIAETSLTIEGIRVVIDSGLTRRNQYDPSTGLNRLVTVRLSASSATQRAGRAGRTGPGRCYRLWSEGNNRSLLPFDPPEIRIVDLAPLVLELANWGIAVPSKLDWLDPPAEGPWQEAMALLGLLGAVDGQGRITPAGRRMGDLPLHPRLARMVLEGADRGAASLACDLAALIEERDIFRRGAPGQVQTSSCDYEDRLEALKGWRAQRNSGSSLLDTAACRHVDKVAHRLRSLVKAGSDSASSRADLVALLLAMAFPDRIARQRGEGSGRYLLANGTGAQLGPRSSLHDQQFIVAVQVVGNQGKEGIIHGASSLSLELIRREFAESIVKMRSSTWNAEDERVAAVLEERLGALVLSTQPAKPGDEEAVSELIVQIRKDPALGNLPWTNSARQFQCRLGFLSTSLPEKLLPDISTPSLYRTLSDWLAPSLKGFRSFADLRRLELLALLHGFCTWEQIRLIDEEAPTHLTVPSGSRLQLDYTDGRPSLSVKLQEMFGLAETPRVALGRVPVLLHLLSPARRPIQVTGDLRSFWDNTYPQVRKELKGRYPKHPWPDNPWSAVPTRGTSKAVRRES